ncbi:unnamed protein product [Bursaphelenchus xylophilus]|uniref:(pine wood nematode) hypothetical protein n=1 Tax=Bursaphelenchus xylophilus TaxID=6326 RepID=A0A7I8X0V1_BURXY|nr:unnamed protein product [Bursaphelenchus xylophilus]CAG9129686.1 unnamed protein product [Bursaphelenchus xylophilus]
MRALVLALLCFLVDSQQYYYYYPYPQQQRQSYYPVRTNCVNRCVPNTRYRWTYRPINVQIPFVQRPNPNIPLKPMPSPQPIVPIGTRGTLAPLTYPTTSTTTVTTTTTPPTPPPFTQAPTEMPTPPPYTGTYPPKIEASTYLRPSKKPEIEGIPYRPGKTILKFANV